MQLADAPPRLADARLHAPPARAAGLPRPPPARVLLDVPARRAAVRARARRDLRAAARRGRAGGRELRDRPRPASRASSASRASRRTRSTPSPTATSCSTTSRRPPPARRTSRAWARRSCCGRARSSGSARCRDAWASGSSIMPQKKNPDAAELLRAKAPRVVAHLVALHGVMHGAPADLQQGHAGGQGAPVRRRRHARPVPRRPRPGCSPASPFDRERLAGAAADEMIAAVDVADLLVTPRRAVPRSRTAIVAGLVREAVDSGRTLSELTPEELAAALRGARRRVLRGALPGGRGSSPRSPRAAPRSTACASSSRTRARSSTASRLDALARLLRPPGGRGRARPARLRRAPRRRRRRDRRDRGLPRLRAGLPRVRRPDARARSTLFGAARAAPTSTAPTASTRC